jgi:C4-dicarboxylate transporter DctM subunit
MTAIYFTIFIALALGAVPIAFALALGGIAAILVSGSPLPLTTIPQRMFGAVDSFPFLAIPFFVLVGDIMSKGGITRRLIDLAAAVIGAIHGGLAIITQVAGSLMDAMSGSSAASTAAMGSVMLPEMIRERYDRAWAAVTVAASGVTGVIIPPSITFVVYGSVTSTSIGKLFIGGILPGFFIVFSLCLLFAYQARRRNYPVRHAEITFHSFATAFRRAIPALLVPIIVMGGIYGGIFTPTEAGAVAAVYTFVLATAVHRELQLSDVWGLLVRAGITTAAIMLVVAAANILGFVVTFERVPQAVAAFMVGLSQNPQVTLLILMVIFLISGMFITASAAVVILMPIILPIIAKIGIDPVFFGVLAVVNLGIGTVTPPLGVNLFIVSAIAQVPIDRIIRELWPVLVVLLLDLTIFMFFPDLVMFLPNLMSD